MYSRHAFACESLESRRLLASHGLNASYFNHPDFTGSTFERLDANVHMDFGVHARPAPGIHGNTYSIRWDGLIEPAFSETYTFSVRHNDGVRLWINGQLIIDKWHHGPHVTDTGSIALRHKHFYDLRLEFFDGTRTAAISLMWSSHSQPLQVVPTDRLFAYNERFAQIGDFGRTTPYATGTAKIVLGWNPDFIVTAGDNNYTSAGYDGNVGIFYHRYIGHYKGVHGAGSPTNRFWPVLGNHDSTGAYEDFFTLPGNERYYDFVQGDVHFFMLNSNKDPDGDSPDSVQGQWLKAHMTASKALYNIVIFHHAPFSSGHHANVSYMRWPFKQWGADVVIAGHDHDYERLVEGGLLYFVNGAGASPRSIGSPIPGSKFQNNTDSGAMLIQANDIAMTFQFELRDGRVIDIVTIQPTA
jgi:hypothetical protein